MKKIFGVILLSIVSLSFLVAQEEEESSFGNPSFSLENEITLSAEKKGEESNKGNFELSDIENETKAKFAVGFAIGDNFGLKPYVSDKVKLGKDAQFKSNEFEIGLGGSYKPIDMIALKFGLGYVSKYDVKGWGDQKQGNGVKFNTGLDLTVDSFFIELGIGYKFSGMFAKEKTGKETDKYVNRGDITNTFAIETKFDFFNFIKEELNSGLVLSDEFKFKSNWAKKGEAENSADYTGERKLENEFGIGLHFAPINYLDFTFLVKVISESERPYHYDSAGKSGKYMDDGESSNAVALSLGLAFSKDMFSFGIEYSPTLSKKTVKNKTETNEENLGHELKISVGIEL